MPGLGGVVARDHALVAQVTDDAGQRLRGDAARIDVEPAGRGLDLGQPRILRAGLDQDFTHVFGVILQCRRHRIDAGDPLFLAHQYFFLVRLAGLACVGGGAG